MKLYSVASSVLLSSALFLSLNSFAQVTDKEGDLKKQSEQKEEGWLKGGMASLTFNQVSLTNWAAGGNNTVAFTSFFNTYANYKKGKLSWDNNLDLAYGLMRQGDNTFPWIKSDDRIELTSKAGKAINTKWYYAGLLNFRSQFAPGYQAMDKKVKISDFMSPGYLLVALGLDYKPVPSFSAFFAPLTGKTTIVLDQTLADAGAYGVEKATFDDLGKMLTKGSNIRNGRIR